MSIDSINIDKSSSPKTPVITSISDTVSIKTDSLFNKADSYDPGTNKFLTNKIVNFLSITKYKTDQSNLSITGFGCFVLFLESVFSHEFQIFDWSSYVIPISFIASILGLVVSIKSRRRKHQFLFICSLAGIISISLMGFLVGNLGELFFGFWMVAVLYLINALLAFILWKNYSLEKK